MKAFFLFYVRDQKRSRDFYAGVLAQEPVLDVSGITEFRVGAEAVFCLMPEAGARRLLGEALPDPAAAHGVPRAELYLMVSEPAAFHRRALERGARELSPLLPRDWGHRAAYSLDPDGHVLAFAERSSPGSA
jgi:catechol 2,3-dioxygenase-like lactoylglutathione lyase family enzyme